MMQPRKRRAVRMKKLPTLAKELLPVEAKGQRALRTKVLIQSSPAQAGEAFQP